MKHKVFTVYDSKAKAFLKPFFFPAVGLALRAWEDTVNTPDTQFCRYPADFTLFEVAEYDEETGLFTNLQAHVNLGTALQFKKAPTAPAPLLDLMSNKVGAQ